MMLLILWRLTRGYRLRPWNSPYLRWRMETYWGRRSEEISFFDFWRFAWKQRWELLRYLRWASRMEAEVRSRGPQMPGPSGAARL
jgi:hypothetical protein